MSLPLPSGTVGVAYNATFTIQNATFANILNLPAGLTATYVASGANLNATISGTPLVAFNGNIQVSAKNEAAGCAPTNLQTLNAGNLTISLPQCATPTVISALSPTTIVIGTAYSGTFSVGPATAVNTVSNIPPGLSATFGAPSANGTIVVTLAGTPTVAGNYQLEAAATNACSGGNSAIASNMPVATGASGGNVIVTAVAKSANVSVQKTVSPANPVINTPTTYNITVSNISGNPVQVSVADTLPAGFTQTSNINFPVTTPLLNPGDSHVISVTGTFSAAATGVTNTATATVVGGSDPNTANNTASVTHNVLAVACPCPTKGAKSLADCYGDKVYEIVLAACDTRATKTFTDCYGDSMLLAASADTTCGITKAITDCFGDVGYGFP